MSTFLPYKTKPLSQKILNGDPVDQSKIMNNKIRTCLINEVNVRVKTFFTATLIKFIYKKPKHISLNLPTCLLLSAYKCRVSLVFLLTFL